MAQPRPVERASSRPTPRLLYVGDVPVEDSVASGTLLYRIFEEYPPESLCIAETGLMAPTGQPRLRGVRHESLPVVPPRLLRTRVARAALAWEWLAAPLHARLLSAKVRDFAPEAVVTTVPYSSWAIARSFARLHSLPLHLLVWDDILTGTMAPSFLVRRYESDFLEAYAAARSRICISPRMESEYRRMSGALGTVVYPFRGRALAQHPGPPERARRGPFTFAFAGSLFLGGYARALAQVARACETAGFRLLVVGPGDDGRKAQFGLDYPCVRMVPYMPVSDLVAFLRREADALVLVGTFEPTEERYASVLFPSRLVTYAAAALPCAAYGPESFAGIEWVRRHVGAEVCLTREDPGELLRFLERFARAAERHDSWGRAMAAAGTRDFDYEAAKEAYLRAFGHASAA